jgi:hypothetical protein
MWVIVLLACSGVCYDNFNALVTLPPARLAPSSVTVMTS